MTGINETELVSLPKDWIIKRIDEVYDFKNKSKGKNFEKVKQVPFIPMDLIPDDRLFVRDFELRDISDISSGTYIENGDLLIAKITPSFENGKQAIVDFKHKFGFATTEVIPIKEKERISNKQYLYYYLLKRNIRSFLANKMEGSTGRQRLSKTILGETLIPFPSISEQNSIVYVLSKIQSAIEMQEKIIQTTTELKKALMQKLFTEGLHGEPQKETEIGKIPKSWEVKKIKEICKIGTGGTPNTKLKEYYEPPEINWLKSGDINGLYITKINNMISILGKENSNANTLYPPGSVMIAMSGRGKTRGTTAVLKVESTCSQSVAAIVPKKEINSEFLHFSLQYRYYEIRNITGHADRSGLNLGLIGNIKVFVPSLKDQEEIVKILVELERKIQIASMKQESLRKLFKSMLHHLMTGQIRVKELKFS